MAFDILLVIFFLHLNLRHNAFIQQHIGIQFRYPTKLHFTSIGGVFMGDGGCKEGVNSPSPLKLKKGGIRGEKRWEMEKKGVKIFTTT